MDRTVYGLSVEEQVDLDSEDEEFFGEQNTDSVARLTVKNMKKRVFLMKLNYKGEY